MTDKDSYFLPVGYDTLTILKGSDINGDLDKLYEERIPYVKPKNVMKEEEVVCQDISAFLSTIRPSRVPGSTSNARDLLRNAAHNSNTLSRENNIRSMAESELKKTLMASTPEGDKVKEDYGTNSNAPGEQSSTKTSTKIDFGIFDSVKSNTGERTSEASSARNGTSGENFVC